MRREHVTEEQLQRFLSTVRELDWLSSAGEPSSEWRVVASVGDAFDMEGARMLETWVPRSQALEARARAKFGDPVIERVFEQVSAAVQERLYRGVSQYFTGLPDDLEYTSGLYPELMDAVKRDICWAAIEHLLGEPDFFSGLLRVYRRGRWPCAWDGDYPAGRAVVL
jgi:hypothetical protein